MLVFAETDMRHVLKLAAAAAAALISLSPAQAQEKPTLTVMSYSAFAGKYGPGPKLKAAFEATCGCTLTYLATDDAASMLARLKLEGASSPADVVVGLDANLAADARETGLFAPHGLPAETASALPIKWSDDAFAPFDYGWFAFVYDKTKLANPPTSLQALIEAPASLKIVIQDPRSSSVGLGGLLWLRAVYGDKTPEAWFKLNNKIVTVTKGWSDAYGLFLKGEADMVLSYTTSPAYHLIAEKKDQYRAAIFSEGHYLQVEVAGLLKAGKQPALAKAFLAFLTGPEGQKLMPTGQWMYPARAGVDLPPEFAALEKPGKSLSIDPAEVARHRRAWINQWMTEGAR